MGTMLILAGNLSDLMGRGSMTANAFKKEDVKSARKAGMQAHIAKPIGVNARMNTLRSVLKQRDRADGRRNVREE